MLLTVRYTWLRRALFKASHHVPFTLRSEWVSVAPQHPNIGGKRIEKQLASKSVIQMCNITLLRLPIAIGKCYCSTCRHKEWSLSYFPNNGRASRVFLTRDFLPIPPVDGGKQHSLCIFKLKKSHAGCGYVFITARQFLVTLTRPDTWKVWSDEREKNE